MPAGLEVYDDNGVRTFSTNDRVGRVLGSVYTGTSNGAISHGELTNGQAFCTVLPIGATPNLGDLALGCPDVLISGSTISWTFAGWVDQGNAYRTNCLLVYGVF